MNEETPKNSVTRCLFEDRNKYFYESQLAIQMLIISICETYEKQEEKDPAMLRALAELNSSMIKSR